MLLHLLHDLRSLAGNLVLYGSTLDLRLRHALDTSTCQEVRPNHLVELFEVLEDLEPRLLVLRGQELLQIIVSVNLEALSAILVELR